MAKEKKEPSKSSYSLPVRIIALVMGILVTGSVISFLVTLLVNLLSVE